MGYKTYHIFFIHYVNISHFLSNYKFHSHISVILKQFYRYHFLDFDKAIFDNKIWSKNIVWSANKWGVYNLHSMKFNRDYPILIMIISLIRWFGYKPTILLYCSGYIIVKVFQILLGEYMIYSTLKIYNN